MLKCEPCESNLTDFTISDGPHFLFPNSEATEKEYEKRKLRETTQDLGEDWSSNKIIYIKNEPQKRAKHRKNQFRKEGSRENANLREIDGMVPKNAEGISTEPTKVIPCDMVYHDSYKLLFEDTNIHVEIPSFEITNQPIGIKVGKNHDKSKRMHTENSSDQKMEESKYALLEKIEHLKEYSTRQRALLKRIHQKEFQHSMNVISDVLNYNFLSIGKNRYNSQVPLFQKHDHFLRQIIKEKRCAGESRVQRIIEEERIGTKGGIVHETICEGFMKEEIKKKKSPVAHGDTPESVYNRILQIRTTCDPGFHPRVLYPPKHKLESIRTMYIPKSSVLFDSKFESGNLHYVSKERGCEIYVLFLKNDLRSSEKRSQWFFFSASHIPEEYYTEITKGEYTQRNMNEYISEMNRDLSMNRLGVKYSIDTSDRILVKDSKKLKHPFKVRFKIVNMTKPFFLYRDGHSPLTFSSCAFVNENKGWTRSAYDIKYVKNTGVKYYNMKKNSYEVLGNHTYTLEFSYDFMYAYDTVYFSSSYPYTYTHLIEQLELIKKAASEDPEIEYKQELLCRTTCGFECPVLGITNYTTSTTSKRKSETNEQKELERLGEWFMNTCSDITNQEKSPQKDSLNKMSILSNFIKNGIGYEGEAQGSAQKNSQYSSGVLDLIFQGNVNKDCNAPPIQKKIIFISARVHPGESNSSYALQGFLYFLLSKNAYAKILRDEYIFVIIPMLNIDGVILGNNRLCPNGFDLNRHWHRPISYLHPTIYAAKMLIKKISKSLPITFFCDFHGHSTKYNSFVFGNWMSDGMKSTYIKGRKLMEVFPRIFSDTLPWYSLKDTKFKMESANRGIARYICGREFKIECSYTLEMSLLGVQMNKGKNQISKLGRDLFEHWSKYGKDSEEEQKDTKSTKEYEFFYFDENMFVMTGVSFGLSLYKFVNFMNYHKLDLYEKIEEKGVTTTPQSSMSNQSVKQKKKDPELLSKETNGLIKGMSCRGLKTTVSVSPYRKRRTVNLSKENRLPLSSSASFHRAIEPRMSISKSVRHGSNEPLFIKSRTIQNPKESISSKGKALNHFGTNKKSSNIQTISVPERTSLHVLSANEIPLDSKNIKNEIVQRIDSLLPGSNISNVSNTVSASNNANTKALMNHKRVTLPSMEKINDGKKTSNEKKQNVLKNICMVKESLKEIKKDFCKRNTSMKNSIVKNELTTSLNPSINSTNIKTKKHTGLVQKEATNDPKKEEQAKEVLCEEVAFVESNKEKKKLKKKSTSLKSRKPKDKNEKRKKEDIGELQLTTTYLEKLNKKCKSLLRQYSKLHKPQNTKVKTSLIPSIVGPKNTQEKNEKNATTTTTTTAVIIPSTIQNFKVSELRKRKEELIHECKKIKGSEKWIQLKKKKHGQESPLIALMTPHSLQPKRLSRRIKISKRIKIYQTEPSNGVGISKQEKIQGTNNNDSDLCVKIKRSYKKKEIQRIKSRREKKRKGILLNKKFSPLLAALKKYTEFQEQSDENKNCKTSRNTNHIDKDSLSTKRKTSGKKTTRRILVDEKKKQRKNHTDSAKTKERKQKKMNNKKR